MLRPVAGVCNIAEEQRRNNAQTNTDIRHGKWCQFRLLQTRKIVNLFPVMVRNESKTMQVSILTVKGSSFPRGGEGGEGL